MLLLHLSDIHFRMPYCETPRTDPEQPYRTMLVSDIRERCKQLGSVGAILVTGDIAYQAHPGEYAVAKEWIAEVASASGCLMERVYVVPGNHDVDLAISARKSVSNVQRQISGAKDISKELSEQLADADASKALFEPLTAYNEFARQFNCAVFGPKSIFWNQDIELPYGVFLRLHGLTSTLISGINGEFDKDKKDLLLSPLQTVLNPEDHVVNLVMSHHPPDWFKDCDNVEDAIQNRASIHLFGHKHRNRVQATDQYMRFSAGAVNPNQRETAWEPGYNLIKLNINENGGERMLHIEATCLRWQSSPDLFVPKRKPTGKEVFECILPIRGKYVVGEQGATLEIVAASADSRPAEKLDAVEVEMSTENTRNLIYRFWQLPNSQRREIVISLALLDEEELKLNETERYSRALIRAGEKGLIDQMAQMVTDREKQNGQQ